jgi:hypothetical protein
MTTTGSSRSAGSVGAGSVLVQVVKDAIEMALWVVFVAVSVVVMEPAFVLAWRMWP